MSSYQMTFKRHEIKYLLDEPVYRHLRKRLEERFLEDQYGKTTICNIYFDTPDARLIRQSLEKPVYKEKLRLRSYGVPEQDGEVFAELKKKYKGVVYKRRERMVLSEAWDYLCQRKKPGFDTQILHEIDWFLDYYQKLAPAMYISYERIALYGVEDPELRVTFDSHIRWRDCQLELNRGVWGRELLESGQRLMELKIPGAMPPWLSALLDELQIFPASFSKYGRAYQEQQLQKIKDRGGLNCA